MALTTNLMEDFMINVLRNQGLILQILSGLIMDEDQRKQIFEYATGLATTELEQQDEQSGD